MPPTGSTGWSKRILAGPRSSCSAIQPAKSQIFSFQKVSFEISGRKSHRKQTACDGFCYVCTLYNTVSQTQSPREGARFCAVQAFCPASKALAQCEFTSLEQFNLQKGEPPSGRRHQNKRTPFLIVPIGTFSEPCELSGTQADSGSCPPVVFYASNRLISSISVICFVICGACSPSCIGLSTLPMSRYTILILCPAEREYFKRNT